MAKHEFGIMNVNPKPNKRYDSYEPEKYDCISVHDDYIGPLLEKLVVSVASTFKPAVFDRVDFIQNEIIPHLF